NGPTNGGDPSKGVVYGTESPRLVINEAYAEIRNDVGDNNPLTGAQKPFKVNFWFELLNPHNKAVASTGADLTDPNMTSTTGPSPLNRAAVQLRHKGTDPITGQPTDYAVYQLIVTVDDNNNQYVATDMPQRANTSGDVLTNPTSAIKLRLDFNNAQAG